jgi:hypothetical protein
LADADFRGEMNDVIDVLQRAFHRVCVAYVGAPHVYFRWQRDLRIRMDLIVQRIEDAQVVVP